MPTHYDRTALTEAVASSTLWAGVMRVLGVKASGGTRRAIQRQVSAHGIDAGHFTRRASRLTYSDAALAAGQGRHG